jgi:alpha-1,2-glucosyltransferase
MESSILLSRPTKKLQTFYKKNRHSPVFISCSAFFILSLVMLILPEKQLLHVDEHTHYAQIVSFYLGDFNQNSRLTTLPGYHALITVVGIMFDTVNINFIRFTSLVTASLAIGYFSKLDQQINGKLCVEKVSAFALFPLIFPFFFLIYTDTLSLLLFLMSMKAGLEKKYQLAALLGLLNLIVRQNTFFWYIFSFMLFFLSYSPVYTLNTFKQYLKRSWLFAVGVIAFILFVIINKGVAIGDKSMHPGNAVNFGNIFYFLFLTGVFIFPFGARKLNRPPLKYLLTIPIMFAFYWLCFEVTHPYNNFGIGFFLRNDLLRYAESSFFAKTIFFVPIAAGMLTLWQFHHKHPRVFFLYIIFGVLSILPSWLIEQRYYFVHFVLLLLFSPLEYFQNNRIILYAYSLVSVFLIYGIFNNLFFI